MGKRAASSVPSRGAGHGSPARAGDRRLRQPPDAVVAIIVAVLAFGLAAFLIISDSQAASTQPGIVLALLSFAGAMFGYAFKREKT